MVKVILLVTKDDIGGAQKYVRDLAEKLDRKRFEVKIITGGKTGVQFLSNAFRPHFLFLNDLAALFELIFIFRREKPSIVHLNSSKAGVIGAFAAFLYNLFNKLTNSQTHKLKTVFTAHGWVFNPSNKLSWLRRYFYIFFHKIAARFQDTIITVSDYDQRLALSCRIAPQERLVTVYNGIATPNFIGRAEARRLIKKLTCVPVDEKSVWVGSVGRLVVEKNYETYIEAVTMLPNFNFFIIGTGHESSRLQAKIKNLGLEKRCFIIGKVVPAAIYLRAFDIFVLTSIKEGLPYTMLEAMAAQIPLIVTRVGGMTEIVQNRGLVMPPRQPQEIARAIKHLLEHPDEAKQFSAAAKQFLDEKLTLERMIQETEKIYLTHDTQ